jgi:magnesium chelatase family protein
MIIRINTATNIGLKTERVECEIDFTPSLPQIIIVGLPDKAVSESKERIRSAIKQSGYEFPLGKITVNLAPADVYKTGAGFDLPIAIGILKLMGAIEKEISNKTLFVGELSLDGKLRPVNGVLSICLWAKAHGYNKIFIPKDNANEGALVKNLEVFAIESLKQLTDILNSKTIIKPVPSLDLELLSLENAKLYYQTDKLYPNDFAYIRGQQIAKRALEIAASGGHNAMFIGQPGSGKTLLARSYPTILPRMTENEILEVTQIYSVAGLLKGGKILSTRPFRSPHHSSSYVALVGGGSKLRPGEISLSHRGVLFLDEFPEFSRETTEALRQPLEDGFVTISRASGTVEYPSRFYLLAAANPTPSGYNIDDPDALNRPQNKNAITRYQAKFSGPILDRIDIQVEVNRPNKDELQNKVLSERSIDIAKRVQSARDIQTKRFEGTKIHTNSEMNLSMIDKFCVLEKAEKELLAKAIDKYKMSARSYMRIIKLSRTIADLENKDRIEVKHIAESLQYRGKW